MGLPQWFIENWFVLLQSIGIIAGLIFTAVALQTDAKVRRIQNLLTLTEHHREIWTKLYERPELSRLLSSDRERPATVAEELFVNLVVLHLNSVYLATKQGVFTQPEGLQRDIQGFFTLRVPRAVWNRLKVLQDEDFVRFVETAMKSQ